MTKCLMNDIDHIIEFLSPTTLAAMLADLEEIEHPTMQQLNISVLLRNVLNDNVGGRDKWIAWMAQGRRTVD